MKTVKQRNFVAKHSRSKTGAGAHKSVKDYNKKRDRIALRALKRQGVMAAF